MLANDSGICEIEHGSAVGGNQPALTGLSTNKVPYVALTVLRPSWRSFGPRFHPDTALGLSLNAWDDVWPAYASMV
jgi:hypothetical protein